MHIVDLLIVLFVCAGAWNGYRTGAIGQVLRIVGTFASYWIALRYHSLLTPVIQHLFAHAAIQQNAFASTWVEQGMSFIAAFILATILFSFVSMVLQGIFELPGLSFINRIAGFLLGTCLSIVVIAILIEVCHVSHIPSVDQAVGQSKIAQSFSQALSGVFHSIPSEIGNSVHSTDHNTNTSTDPSSDPFHIT